MICGMTSAKSVISVVHCSQVLHLGQIWGAGVSWIQASGQNYAGQITCPEALHPSRPKTWGVGDSLMSPHGFLFFLFNERSVSWVCVQGNDLNEVLMPLVWRGERSPQVVCCCAATSTSGPLYVPNPDMEGKDVTMTAVSTWFSCGFPESQCLVAVLASRVEEGLSAKEAAFHQLALCAFGQFEQPGHFLYFYQFCQSSNFSDELAPCVHLFSVLYIFKNLFFPLHKAQIILLCSTFLFQT